MKKLSKIIILVLSVALICTGLVLAVSADEATFDLKSAINNAAAGDTIVMTGNAVLSKATGVDGDYGITISKKLTIDLNGYTIDAPDTHRVFNMNGVDVDFTITGSGTINVGGALVYMGQNKDGNVGKIIGTGSGITINHTGTGTKKDGTTVQKMFFAAQRGNYTFKNFTLNTTSAGDHIFKNNSTANMTFEQVQINATKADTGKAAIFYPNNNGSISLNYCKVSTLGHSAFAIPDNHATKVENYIVVDNSWINVAYGNGGFASLIYSNYQSIGSDVVFSNSYCSWNSRMLIKHNLNGTALTFKNCDLMYNGKGGSWFRSSKVKLEDGTRLWGIHSYYPTDTQFYTNYDNSDPMTVGENTGVYMIIGEGTRFDVATYNKLINRTGAKKDDGAAIDYYTDGYIVYPDGSTPIASTTYKMVYDIVGDPITPYVVVKADAAGTADAHTFALFETSPNFRTIWHGSGVTNNITLNDGNVVRRWISNGKKNADGATPNTYVGFSSGVAQSTYDVFVFDLDISADSANKFADTSVALHARSSTSANSGNGRQVGIINISSDGLATANSGVTGGTSTVQLNAGEWNHITIVVDATVETTGAAYVYVNGVYMGTGKGYTADDACLFGMRFDITGNGTLDTNATIITDNVAVRGYGDGTSTTALTDNGASYLINGGMAWNEGTVNDTFNVAGLAVNDANEALKLNRELGLSPVITAPITHPVHATENGKIYANGYELSFAETSYPADVVYNADGSVNYYEVDSELANYSVTYKYFLGTLESQKSNPDYWVSVVYKAGNAPGAYETELLDMMFTNQGDGTYLYHTQKGWAKVFGAADVDADLYNALTASFVKTHNGETVEVYPVFNAGAAHNYNWLVKRSDGSVRFAHTTNGMYGTDWLTRGLDGKGDGDGSGAVKLEYGETYVVLTDELFFAAAFNSPRKTKGTADELVFNFDLNGHKLLIDSRNNDRGHKLFGVFIPKQGETYNIYSSVAGASIDCYGHKNVGTKANPVTGDDLSFALAGGVLALVNANDSFVNIGKTTVNGITYPGSNLTVMGDQIAQTDGNSSGGAINIEDCTVVRSTYDMTDMFNTRTSTSPINVKNCNIVIAAGGPLAGNHATSDAFEAGGEINFINSTIITANGADLISNNQNNNRVNFVNCVTNGKINAAGNGKLTVKDTACYSADVAAPEGYVLAKYNLPMTLTAAIETYYNTTDGTEDAEVIRNVFTVESYGSEAEASVVLPLLTYKYVPAEDAVKVTWNGLGTNEAVVEDYAIGGNVIAIDIADCKLNAINLVHNGSFAEELATNVQADAVYTPVYTTEATVSGLKANLSLYSDFLVNLYIPANYAPYITAVNEKALAEGTVNFGYAAEFVKATVAKNAKEASADAVFEIAIKEGDYTATKTVSISITDYASKILAGEQFADTDKALMYYMLNYAAEAAEYLGGSADAEIAALLETYAQWDVIEVAKNFGNAVADTGLDSVFSYAGITLEAAPAFTFTPNGKFTGTVTVTYGDGNVREYTVPENSEAKILVEGMKIYNFATNITVTAVGTIAGVDGEQTVTGTINLDTYAKYHTENAANDESATKAESAAALDLINALYDYVKVAEQYKAGTLEIPTVNDGGEATPEPAPAE